MLHCADSHDRIRRADEHARTFVNACLRFLNDDPKPFGITLEMRDDRQGVVRLIPQKTVQWDLPLIVGEFFYQLQAALDGAMWTAYKRLGTSDPSGKLKQDALYFPFSKSPGKFKDCTFNLIPLPQKLWNWLESIQVYKAQDLAPGSEEERNATTLRLVNTVAKTDRHRKPRLVASVISNNTALVSCTPPASIAYIQNLPVNPLEGQYEIAIFGVDGMTAETELYVNGNFSLEIGIEGVPNGAGFMLVLFEIKQEVFKAIRRFDEAIT